MNAKIVMIGSSKIGKTAFAETFISGSYKETQYRPTIGATMHKKNIVLADYKNLSI